MQAAANLIPLNYIFIMPLALQLIYLLSCFFVALFGRDKKMGFWGYFFFSIIFSPVMGALVVIVT